ncbi:MAG: hypothetical protein U1G08_10135 [Verrucomicrobiota bacterium]
MFLLGVLLLILGAAGVLRFRNELPFRTPLPRVQLWNGQQLQIEAVHYGTNLVLGRRNLVGDLFGPWLPNSLVDWFSPVVGQTRWSAEVPQLIVWLNGFDPATGQFVDCQRFRVELVDDSGDVYPSEGRSWHGFQKFSRVGHGFSAFPRRDEMLRLRFTPYSTNISYTLTIPNPGRITEPPVWPAAPLPLSTFRDGIELRLSGLAWKTNGASERPWETPSVHWQPQILLLSDKKPATGWLDPEWWAEDPTGNRGQTLGLHEPVQRFHLQAFPSVTNSILDRLAVRLPTVSLDGLGAGILWEIRHHRPRCLRRGGSPPPGMHLFTAGRYTTNPPPGGAPAPVSGGAPSGWVGISAQIAPNRTKSWDGHYTPVPTLYLHAPTIPGDDRIGVRIRDEQGRLWTAEAEEQGRRENVRPFLLKLPPDVRTITPEVVFIRPLTAEFTVRVPAP